MTSLVGYRKFTVAVLALLCLTVLCAVGKLTGSEFITGMLGTVGSFILLNVTQKIVENKNAAGQ